MKVLTANRLLDGEAVWFANGVWIEATDKVEIAAGKAHEERLEEAGKQALAANFVVDVNLIDVEFINGGIHRVRLRERIRAAGPTIRTDLGKQARLAKAA